MGRVGRIAVVIVAGLTVMIGEAAVAEISPAACAALKSSDFTATVGKTVAILSTEVAAAEGGKPAHCHVVANIAPSIGVDLRLPLTAWNGRFLFTGCGGLCGVLDSASGDDALRRGYAVATTDMGHRNPPSGEDRAWTNDKGLVEDWLHRSTHLATVLGKAVVKAAYRKSQDHAFYRGCSTGGRQGLTEALLYPQDFDGIVAGAPAAQMVTTHNVFAYATNTRPDGSPILTKPAITLLAKAVQAACDLDDGVQDGVIGNPRRCAFDPAQLQCTTKTDETCLSADQVSVAKKLYSGALKADGTPFYALGYAKGTELAWIRGLLGQDGKPATRAGSAQFLVERMMPPGATLADFDYAKYGTSGGPMGGMLDYGTDGKKLQTYQARGGKILLYHGWSDTDATPASSFDFLDAQTKAFGADRVASFLRLFLLPGMEHCRGGSGVTTADYLTAIETWVEKGTAPEKVIAYKTSAAAQAYSAFPLKPETILASRPLYPYPATAVYGGTGDPKSAANWTSK